jgi:predicted dinucleotide-binding enzyme
MTTWGFIGSGNIGTTVARLALAAGHEVVMSNSRGPATLGSLVAELGERAGAATADQAASGADVVVVTIPLKHYRHVPDLAGKTVIDTMNYYPDRDGVIADLDAGVPSSQLFQAFVPEARVVKAFNNIFFQHLGALACPAGPQRSALPLASDDDRALALVVSLLDEIGYDCVSMGPLANSWRSQPDTPVYGTPYAADPTDWTAGAKQAPADEIAALVAAARR